MKKAKAKSAKKTPKQSDDHHIGHLVVDVTLDTSKFEKALGEMEARVLRFTRLMADMTGAGGSQ